MLDYFDALAELHLTRRPRTYLEIGVAAGDSLRLGEPGTLRVGVDPEPTLAPDDGLRRHVEVMTSDAFFAGKRAGELLGGIPVDLAFIDGMHLFEYALRDFIGVEALAGPDSLVAVHDCLPRDAATASRKRSTEFWTGDVWKLVLCLLDHRPGLDISILDAPPTGLCLVGGLDSSDRTLRDGYEELVQEYAGLGFDAWEARRTEVLERTTGSVVARSWGFRMQIAELMAASAAELAAERARSAAQIEDLRSRLAASEEEKAALLDRLVASDEEKAALVDRLAAGEALVANLQAQLRAVAESASWRTTAPLRRAAGMLRRGGAAE